MSSKKLTVLFTPLNGHGHINACHGIAETLRDRGHRVIFIVDIAFKGKLITYGFEEEIRSLPQNPDANQFLDVRTDFVAKHAEIFRLSRIEIIEKFCIVGFNEMYKDLKAHDSQYKEIITRVKPDVIIIDSYIASPTLTNSGIPWILLYSAAPLCLLNSDKLPPGWSGLPLKGNRDEWRKFKEEMDELFSNCNRLINEWLVSEGAPAIPKDQLHPHSKHLNLYTYPKELDYTEIQPLPSNFRRIDGFVRTTKDTFTLPECLSNRSGKLIFLSMGSFGCANLELMTRLVRILGKSKHRFIVSKGPSHDKYELPDNMWGQQFVPQLAILPLVDLVITHGGNNTVTETFFYGKPMLVMPLFGDQYENAQRIKETGLGLSLNPFFCTEEELLDSVDEIVNDNALADKMKAISERIRKSNDKTEVSELIEKIVKK